MRDVIFIDILTQDYRAVDIEVGLRHRSVVSRNWLISKIPCSRIQVFLNMI